MRKKRNNKTIFSFAYPEDLNQAYAFYCARYENISWEEFKSLKLTEFQRKLNSIPESEPLYKIIKSRTLNISKIKDKGERKYWLEERRINAIPQMYISTEEIYETLKNQIKDIKL